MTFDQNNKVVRLCVQGMEMEAKQDFTEAKGFFVQAWETAENDFEKFTAAHYVARHQSTIQEKLNWDLIALDHALKTKEPGMTANFPSLYLNIGKCFEEMEDYVSARQHYDSAQSFTHYLPDNSYGKLVREGITNGLDRLQKTQ